MGLVTPPNPEAKTTSISRFPAFLLRISASPPLRTTFLIAISLIVYWHVAGTDTWLGTRLFAFANEIWPDPRPIPDCGDGKSAQTIAMLVNGTYNAQNGPNDELIRIVNCKLGIWDGFKKSAEWQSKIIGIASVLVSTLVAAGVTFFKTDKTKTFLAWLGAFIAGLSTVYHPQETYDRFNEAWSQLDQARDRYLVGEYPNRKELLAALLQSESILKGAPKSREAAQPAAQGNAKPDEQQPITTKSNL